VPTAFATSMADSSGFPYSFWGDAGRFVKQHFVSVRQNGYLTRQSYAQKDAEPLAETHRVQSPDDIDFEPPMWQLHRLVVQDPFIPSHVRPRCLLCHAPCVDRDPRITLKECLTKQFVTLATTVNSRVPHSGRGIPCPPYLEPTSFPRNSRLEGGTGPGYQLVM
jgi:hypothetical protein